jgi:hypothetical protein
MPKLSPSVRKYLSNAAWIAAFVAICVGWTLEVLRAPYRAAPSGGNGAWICPIAGNCGPPGTPGLGKW